jgi:hypothetical protein
MRPTVRSQIDPSSGFSSRRDDAIARFAAARALGERSGIGRLRDHSCHLHITGRALMNFVQPIEFAQHCLAYG